MTCYHALTVCAGEVLGEADGGVDNSKIGKLLGFGPLYFGIPSRKKSVWLVARAVDPRECTAMLGVEKLQPCPEQWYAKVLAHGQTLAFHTCNKPLTERRARGVAQPSHNICERAVPSVVRFREARAARVRCRRAGRVRGREPVVQLKPYTTWWDT